MRLPAGTAVAGVSTTDAGNEHKAATPSAPDLAQQTVERFLAAPWRKTGFAESTQKAYAYELAKLRTHLNKTPLYLASEVQLREYLVAMHLRGVRAAAVRRATLAIRCYFAWATLDGWCRANPALRLDARRAPMPSPKSLGHERAGALVHQDRTAGRREQLRDRAMLELAYGAGLRLSELLQLKLLHLNVHAKEVTVFGAGTGKRTLPLSETCAAAVADYLADGRPKYLIPGSNCDILFLTRLGRPLTPSGFWRHLQMLATKAGLDPMHISASSLRQTFATDQRLAGKTPQEVRVLLGLADGAAKSKG